ncbi:MAG: tetratricopeptide repeat protein [Elusimicrobia bacterium]|nr:tetratricopeptide repeat protein [Elusimicrobiota bacterium]
MSSEADVLYRRAVEAQEGGKPAEAERWHRACLDLRQREGDEAGVSRSTHVLALLLHGLGRESEAAEFYRASLALFERLDQAVGTADAAYQLGDILAGKAEYPEAEAMFRRSLSAQEGLEDNEDLLVQTLFGLARVGQKSGKLEMAQACLTRCLSIEESRGLMENQVEILLRLSQVATDRGRREEAEEYMVRLRRLRPADM